MIDRADGSLCVGRVGLEPLNDNVDTPVQLQQVVAPMVRAINAACQCEQSYFCSPLAESDGSI